MSHLKGSLWAKILLVTSINVKLLKTQATTCVFFNIFDRLENDLESAFFVRLNNTCLQTSSLNFTDSMIFYASGNHQFRQISSPTDLIVSPSMNYSLLIYYNHY